MEYDLRRDFEKIKPHKESKIDRIEGGFRIKTNSNPSGGMLVTVPTEPGEFYRLRVDATLVSGKFYIYCESNIDQKIYLSRDLKYEKIGKQKEFFVVVKVDTSLVDFGILNWSGESEIHVHHCSVCKFNPNPKRFSVNLKPIPESKKETQLKKNEMITINKTPLEEELKDQSKINPQGLRELLPSQFILPDDLIIVDKQNFPTDEKINKYNQTNNREYNQTNKKYNKTNNREYNEINEVGDYSEINEVGDYSEINEIGEYNGVKDESKIEYHSEDILLVDLGLKNIFSRVAI